MTTKFPMTTSGHQALKEELDHLKRVERYAIVNEIEVARAHGDLRENAEYHAAKDKQGQIEGRIKAIEAKLSLAEVINPKSFSGDKVLFGAHVTIYDINTEDEQTYQIVGDDESDLEAGKISYASPIAKALIGRRVGDECQIKAPKGVRAVEILEVEYK